MTRSRERWSKPRHKDCRFGIPSRLDISMIDGSTMFRPFEGPCLRSRLTYSEDVEEKGCGGLALSPVIKRQQHWHQIKIMSKMFDGPL